MTQVRVHSQNLRGSLDSSLNWIVSTMNDTFCECTAILLQDIGATGPEGPPTLRHALEDTKHKILTHYSPTNKSRTVAIIVHKSCEIRTAYRDKSGSALGA